MQARASADSGGDGDMEKDDGDDGALDDVGQGDKDAAEEEQHKHGSQEDTLDGPADCPLSYSCSAIAKSMPASLRNSGMPAELALRIWTTALTAACMRTMEISWAIGATGFIGLSPVGDGTPQTMLDRTEAWLAAQQLPPELAGKVQRVAARKIAAWKMVQDQRVTAMRGAELNTRGHAITLMHRSVGAVLHALLTTHQTLGVFLSPYLDCIKRWCALRPACAASCAGG